MAPKSSSHLFKIRSQIPKYIGFLVAYFPFIVFYIMKSMYLKLLQFPEYPFIQDGHAIPIFWLQAYFFHIFIKSIIWIHQGGSHIFATTQIKHWTLSHNS